LGLQQAITSVIPFVLEML